MVGSLRRSLLPQDVLRLLVESHLEVSLHSNDGVLLVLHQQGLVCLFQRGGLEFLYELLLLLLGDLDPLLFLFLHISIFIPRRLY